MMVFKGDLMKNKTQNIILYIILLSYFLILFDNSVLFIGSLQIKENLHISESTLSWIANAYTITFGGALILSGRLGDLYGRKNVFLIGLIIFGVSCFTISSSNSVTNIIVLRALQGIGASAITSNSLALLISSFHNSKRKKAVTYYGMTGGIGLAFGLVFSGFLVDFFSWRAGFFINGLLTFILLSLSLLKLKPSLSSTSRIDKIGAVLSIATPLIFILGIVNQSVFLIFLSLLLLITFIIVESKQKKPLIPLTIFKNKIRASSYALRFLMMMALFPYWFIMPQILKQIYNFNSLIIGLCFLPLTVMNFITASLIPQLLSKFNKNKIILLAQALLVLASVLSLVMPIEIGYWKSVFIPMILFGAGNGLLIAPLTIDGVDGIDKNYSGIASGITNTMNQLGGPTGLAIIMSFVSSNVTKISYYHSVICFIILFTSLAFLYSSITIIKKFFMSQKNR